MHAGAGSVALEGATVSRARWERTHDRVWRSVVVATSEASAAAAKAAARGAAKAASAAAPAVAPSEAAPSAAAGGCWGTH
jgi:hypothetical protein